jgi:hypothetical protein
MTITPMKPHEGSYKTISRWIRIRFTQRDGASYFIFRNRRYHLDEFMRLTYPIMWEDAEGKLHHLSGYDAGDWYNPILLEMDDCGEYVRLWEEVR